MRKSIETVERRALAWLFSQDTGSSSKAICAHMLGFKVSHAYGGSYPSDAGDLGRCLRLLELIPEWKPRIAEMAEYGPGWAGQIACWSELVELMAEEVGIDFAKGRGAPKTYAAMKLAQANGYRNDPRYECHFNHKGHLSSAWFKGDPA